MPTLIQILFSVAIAAISAQDVFVFQGGKCRERHSGNPGRHAGLSDCGTSESKTFANENWIQRSMRGISLRYSIINRGEIRGGTMEFANLRESRWIGPRIRSQVFFASDARGIRIERTRCDSCDFQGVDFRAARVSESKFFDSDFRGARFGDANFYRTHFANSDFREADLSAATFVNTTFEKCRAGPGTKLPWSEAVARKKGFIFE